jgi:hypothetical protein
MDRAMGKLANHVIGETKVEMKNMARARYSYISSKIAKQRAFAEKTKRLNEKAEAKRLELRER